MKLTKIFHRKHTIAGRLTWRVVGTMTVVMTLIVVLIFAFLWLIGAVLLTDYQMASTRIFNEKINNVFFGIFGLSITSEIKRIKYYKYYRE